MNGQAQDQQNQLFKREWWAFELQGYRGCDGTYCSYEYDSLPSIPSEGDSLESLGWLTPLTPHVAEQMAPFRKARREKEKNAGTRPVGIADIEKSADIRGPTLPESFVRLMSSPELQDRIPSCTDCYFELSATIMKYPGKQGGYIVRFLNDQQKLLFWYLYFTPEHTHRVLVTTNDLEEMVSKAREDTAWGDKAPHAALTLEDRQSINAETWVCAESFTEFIYRWWLENSLWFKLSASGKDRTPQSEAEQGYLDQCKSTVATSR